MPEWLIYALWGSASVFVVVQMVGALVRSAQGRPAPPSLARWARQQGRRRVD